MMTRSFFDGCLFLLSINAVTAFTPSVSNRATLPHSSKRDINVPFAKSSVELSSSSSSISNTDYLIPGIQAIQENNADLLQRLEAVRESDYFKLYSVDILGSCEYMPQELFECYTESCEIYPVDEEQVRVSPARD